MSKPIYDRHRRVKQYKIGGAHGLPVIYRTWGQIYNAKIKGRKMHKALLEADK